MRVTVEQTQETELYMINGAEVPVRIWHGTTEIGQLVKLLVLGMVPAELPDPVDESVCAISGLVPRCPVRGEENRALP